MKQNAYLRHLANFVCIVESQSMTAAAEKLGGNPSAMSESVKILENYYGDDLLERRQKGVIPTSKGIDVYEYAQQMVQAANSALKLSSDEQASAIKISLPREIACNGFSSVLADVSTLPGVSHVTLLCEDELLDHDRFSRDLYVRVGSTSLPKNIHVLHTHESKAVFATHAKNAKKININRMSDITKQPLLCKPQVSGVVSYSFGDSARQSTAPQSKSLQTSTHKITEVTFKNTIHIDDIQTRISIARSGFGVVCCLYQSVREDFESGHMVQLSPRKLNIPITLQIASPKSKPRTSVIEAARCISDWIERQVT